MKNRKYIPVYISCSLIICFFFYCLAINIIPLMNPANRTGPFGIGLPAPMERFYLKDKNISILKPTSWVAYDIPQGVNHLEDVILVINARGRGIPRVTLYEISHIENIEKMILWRIKKIKSEGGYNFTSHIQEFTSARYDMKLITYSFRSESIFSFIKIDGVDCNDYVIYKDNTGYLISFCAYKHDWSKVDPVFDEMINSLIIE